MSRRVPNLGARDVHGWTPLHVAAIGNDDTDLIAALIETGADIETRDGTGDTPLKLAAMYNRNSAAITAALLEAGADIEARDDND